MPTVRGHRPPLVQAQLRAITSLLRVVDPGVASNRFVLLALVTTFLVSLIANALGGSAGITGAAANDAIAVFLGWAISRELDPDLPRSARYGAILTAAALVLIGPAMLGASGAVLLATRMVTRTTGQPPTWLDLGALVAVGWAVSATPTGLVAAAAVAAALAVDARLPDAAPARNTPAAAVVLVVSLAGAITNGGMLGDWHGPGVAAAVTLLAVTVAVIRLAPTSQRAVGDLTGEPLLAERLVASYRTAGVVFVGAFLWAGADAAAALAPVAGAVLGVAVSQVAARR